MFWSIILELATWLLAPRRAGSTGRVAGAGDAPWNPVAAAIITSARAAISNYAEAGGDGRLSRMFFPCFLKVVALLTRRLVWYGQPVW
jgi:hypothetical protein